MTSLLSKDVLELTPSKTQRMVFWSILWLISSFSITLLLDHRLNIMSYKVEDANYESQVLLNGKSAYLHVQG